MNDMFRNIWYKWVVSLMTKKLNHNALSFTIHHSLFMFYIKLPADSIAHDCRAFSLITPFTLQLVSWKKTFLDVFEWSSNLLFSETSCNVLPSFQALSRKQFAGSFLILKKSMTTSTIKTNNMKTRFLIMLELSNLIFIILL